MYMSGYSDAPGGWQDPNAGGSWVENAIDDAGSWIVSLFGNQAEERNLKRFAQNEAAFRAAAAGGSWDREFLRARGGLVGVIDIPVRLPYAKSPSSGRDETPGGIGGWATGPAKRHAEALYVRLEAGGTDLPGGADYDPDVMAELYNTARAEGRSAAESLLQTIAANLYGQIPAQYRQAIEQGVREHYAGAATGQLNAALPWIVGLGIGLAVLRQRKR